VVVTRVVADNSPISLMGEAEWQVATRNQQRAAQPLTSRPSKGMEALLRLRGGGCAAGCKRPLN